ncbi:holo-[acyl-carrier-protein] synthase [Geobacter sp. FeAm09]|uniref:holo-[acyl-carrier-protein] synthase n=1 Tax=Geobacter sp. FeAm09 TaxID=2597769 RepID=UPI0011F05FD1|nr:holo-[acyl-carrier-protein] synthase [Geobacter sp. FeAm09]QEM68078.1 holo-[acyl-carrier-protein] synthase [Geobacter sp. FeAm09]
MIFGIGVDTVEIARFRRFLEEGNRVIIARLFTETERERCNARKDAASCYAARFAAKEAFLKALGSGLRDGISWHDMAVVNDGAGKPDLRLTGQAERIFTEKGLGRAFLSLSHDGGQAVAMVVLEAP